jgi:hypothetical protein
MSNEQCDLCHRDLSPGVLVRCREIDCPLARSRTHASITILSSLLGMAVIVGIVVAAWSALTHRPRPADDAGVPVAAAEAQSVSAGREISGAPVLGKGPPNGQRGDARSANPPAGAAAEEFRETADPRAARLVQSFPCEGDLSASRLSICTHMSLATSDYNLSLQYKSALRRSRNPQGLRQKHNAWLAKLDDLDGDLSRLRKAFADWRDELTRM